MKLSVMLGAGGCSSGKIRRKAYTTRKGIHVKASCVPDKGAKGKGPRSLPTPRPGSLEGWKKDLPSTQRHAILHDITKREGCGVTIKKLTLLQNITADGATKRVVKRDKKWLREQRFCELVGGK